MNKVVVQFPKEYLLELLEEGNPAAEILDDILVDHGRWSLQYRLVFKVKETEKIYCVIYSRGATESQDEHPFEYDGDMINCYECEAVEKTIIEYKTILR